MAEMPNAASRLSGHDDLRALADLESSIFGKRSPSLWDVPHLSAIERSGGLLLGVREEGQTAAALQGGLVDLVARFEGHSAYWTVLLSVAPDTRNSGVAQTLRRAERIVAGDEGVSVVRWTIDPLRSIEAHIAFNKLGAIATGYVRNLYGEVDSPVDRGLATDRLIIEWWTDAPRTLAVCDDGQLPPHYRLGLHEMTVLTQTTVHASGQRVMTGYADPNDERHVLVEVPVDLEVLRNASLDIARAWRIETRELFESLFEKGYVVVGFVHEAGRSFHLMERADRGAVLGRSR